MSLKAKLEAVIYAAEEPVTLAQLAAIFAVDAFEWEAEQVAARAARSQPEQSAAGQYEPAQFELEPSAAGYTEPGPADAEAGAGRDPAAPLLLLNESSAMDEPARSADPAKESVLESGPESGSEDSSEAGPAEAAASAQAEAPEAAATPEAIAESPAPGAEAAESDLKREARQRDREVRAILRQVLDELVADCVADGRGIEIREIAGGYRMATKPECHDAVRMFVKSLKPPLKLSLPALETLAVVAYKQPITAPEVNEIRGVDSSGVFGSLLARKLIATAGRKQVIGRPILYKTTREFLLRFGLKDVSELPSMEEFEKMAAIELEEPDTTETGGEVTEIGEPEPIAPQETAEAIADDLQEELADATAGGEPLAGIEQAAETDGETGQTSGPASNSTSNQASNHVSNQASNHPTNHAADGQPAGDSASESSGQPSSVSHSEE